MATKQCKVKREICLSNRKEDENNIGEDIDLNQINDQYLLQL